MPADFSRYREVIPYSRFSSALQALGTSEERQHDAAAAFALTHGIDLSPRRVDRAKSGSKGHNLQEGGALQQIIRDLASSKIPTPCLLLIERQDRYGRLPPTQALTTLFGSLLEKGCDLYHLQQGRLYSAASVNQNFGDLVTLAAEVHAAHQYAVQLSERSLVAHQKARQRMLNGEAGIRPNWAPAWIAWDDDSKQWRLNAYSSTVQQLLDHVDSGLGQIRTAAALNNAGHRTPRNKEWTAGSVSHILYSPAVAGGREIKRRSGQVVWGSFPAVVSRARWESIKAKVAARDNAAGLHGPQGAMQWLGQGVTTCTCGKVIGYRVASCLVKGQRVRHQYLRCRGRIKSKSKQQSCDQPALRMKDVELHVLARLAMDQWQQLFPDDTSGQLQQLQQREQQAKQHLTEAQAMVAVAEAELTRAMREEPSLVSILARQVAAAEQAVATAEQQHLIAAGDVEAAASDRTRLSIQELQQQVQQLRHRFLDDNDTSDDRRTINTLLRQLNLKIVVDAHGNRLGLQIADGPISWEEIDVILARIALHEGGTSLSGRGFEVPDDGLEDPEALAAYMAEPD